MTDRNVIAQIISFISAGYPNFNPTEATVEFYFEALRDIPEAELKVAALQCCMASGRQFAPSAAEIRGEVSALRTRQRGIPSSYEAWQEVLTAPKSGRFHDNFNVPPLGTVTFHTHPYVWSHLHVETTARLMGWPDFPGPPETRAADRARFIECYKQQVEEASKSDMLLPEVKAYLEQPRSLPDETPKSLKGFLEAKVTQRKERRKKESSSTGRGFGRKRPRAA